MTVLKILKFPDPRLKNIAEPVSNIDDEIRQIAKNLFETMYQGDGIGLAAIQVNINKRIIVLDLREDDSKPICLINPIITEQAGNISFKEGCLSFPGIYVDIKRNATVTVEYQDIEGNKQSIHAGGLFSVCLQHEIDHLNGITLYNRVSPLKKILLKKKLKKLQEQ